MENRIPEIASDHVSLLGEGPVWDSSSMRISWVDILRGEILELSVQERRFSKFNVGQHIGCIACRQSGGYVAGLETGFSLADPVGGTLRSIDSDATSVLSGRFNDGKCDPSGRFWAGTVSDTAEGSLYMLDVNMEISVKATGISCSNGLAWDDDRSCMYYIDTPNRDIFVYDYSDAEGIIANKRVAFTVDEKDGWPDGMCIDRDGMLWLALWDGWQLQKWDPVQGTLLERISLPVARPTSCVFGGKDLRDLYVTSASFGVEGDWRQKDAGKLFVIRDAGRGLAGSKFRG